MLLQSFGPSPRLTLCLPLRCLRVARHASHSPPTQLAISKRCPCRPLIRQPCAPLSTSSHLHSNKSTQPNLPHAPDNFNALSSDDTNSRIARSDSLQNPTFRGQRLSLSSAVKNPAILISALEALVHDPDATTEESQQWALLPTGDALARNICFADQSSVTDFQCRLKTMSDEMNHHASVNVQAGPHLVEIVVTTHRPKGLSMRDIRLARRIDELVLEMQPGILTKK